MRKLGHFFFLAGALLVLLPFLPLLLDPERAILYRDISNIQIPYKATWMAAVMELGRIPHWDSLHVGGFPFLVDLNYGPLYPLNWLLFPLSFGSSLARGLSYLIIIHHLLIYTGCYLLFRDLKVRPALAVAGGLAAAWAGASMSSDNLLHHICSQASVGFFFYFWRRSLRRQIFSPYHFAASAALAWPVYSGDPQYTYFMALGGALMLFLYRNFLTGLFRFGALGVLSVLVSGPQLFSTGASLLSKGRLLDALTDLDRLSWSLHPWRLFETFFPLPFGRNPAEFWASDLMFGISPIPFLFSIYAGSVIVTLALLHLSLRRPFRNSGAKELRRMATLFLFSLLILLTLGIASPIPVYQFALDYLPIWKSFRYPERIGYWISFVIILYAILGGEKILRLQWQPKLRYLAFPIGIVSCSGLVLGLWIFSRGQSTEPIFRSLAFFSLVVALLWKFPNAGTRLASIGLVILVVLDMAPVAKNLVWGHPLSFTDSNNFRWATKILDDRKNLVPGQANRFFSLVEKPLFMPGSDPGSFDNLPYYAWAGMMFNTPSYWGIPLVRGHSSLIPQRPVLSITGISAPMVSRVLNLHSARYLLRLDGDVPVASVNQDALPLVFAPRMTEIMESEESLLKRLKSADWTPATTALIENNLNSEPLSFELKSYVARWDQMTIKALSPAKSPAGWLVVNHAYDKQWRAQLNDQDLTTARANGWALAVHLPPLEAGTEFELQLQFTDHWFRAGLFALTIWILLFTFFSCLRIKIGARMIRRG